MSTKKSRKEAIKLAIFSTRNIYRAVIAGEFSRYYGTKLAGQYWHKLNLKEHEKFRYFGTLSNPGYRWYRGMGTPLDWLLNDERDECLTALRYFGLIEGKTEKPGKTRKKQKAV
jgi:hypothetical protein